jgi:hypothetical protein
MVPFSFFGWQKSVVSALYRNEMHYVNNCALLKAYICCIHRSEQFWAIDCLQALVHRINHGEYGAEADCWSLSVATDLDAVFSAACVGT